MRAKGQALTVLARATDTTGSRNGRRPGQCHTGFGQLTSAIKHLVGTTHWHIISKRLSPAKLQEEKCHKEEGENPQMAGAGTVAGHGQFQESSRTSERSGGFDLLDDHLLLKILQSVLPEYPASLADMQNLCKLRLVCCRWSKVALSAVRFLQACSEDWGSQTSLSAIFQHLDLFGLISLELESPSYMWKITSGHLHDILPELPSLKSLALKDCEWSDVDGDFIHKFPNLESLLITNLYDPPSHVVKIPPSLHRLQHLRDVRICVRRVESLENLLLCKGLTTLCLMCDDMDEVPDEIGRLENLVYLKLMAPGKSSRLPFSIGYLTKLQALCLEHFDFIDLPESIGRLQSLRVLNVTCCSCGDLPSSMVGLEALEELVFESSTVWSFPQDILDLPRLQTLHLPTVIDVDQAASTAYFSDLESDLGEPLA